MNAIPASATLLSVCIRTPEGEWPIAEATGWTIELLEEAWDGPGVRVAVRAHWQGTTPAQAGLVVRRRLSGTKPGRVLVPGVFYGDNGAGGVATHYPRLGPLDAGAFTAPSWDFAAERAPLPAVFAWHDAGVTWLAVEPHGTGVGFSLADDNAELRVHCPGVERPFRHDRLNEAPSEPWIEIAPGGVLEMRVWYGEQPLAPNAYAPVQRALQTVWSGAAPRPVDGDLARAAADAAAEGLLRWHFRPDLGAPMLAEAVSFDGADVRAAMHLGWVSGAPAAYALLEHGRRHGDSAAAAAGRAVLDTVAGGLAPCGAFWGIWTPQGWKAGWNGDPQKLHARTLAEATLFLARALALEPDHPTWAAAVRSNLEFCLRAMDATGHPGSYYHAQTGEVLDRRGTAGLLWAAALTEGAKVLWAPAYGAVAARVGAAYAGAIREGALLGAPEDIGLCPSSEDGYNALIAMMALYESTQDRQWLDLARIAADWTLTFRWSYDARFPVGSPLAARRFQTRGADTASPSNHHLHAYGLICQPELLRLSALCGDPWYAARAADHLACFLGEVALRDGQFGGAERRGMMAEQWYTANWAREGRAGDVGPVSHAWCLGLVILAADGWVSGEPNASAPVPVRDGGERPTVPSKNGATSDVARPAPARKRAGGEVRRRRQRAVEFPADGPHPVRLLPGLYQVGGGYLSHSRDAASYLLLDEATGESILVDCGSHSGLTALRANVAAVADWKKVRLVIGTHGHWDHVDAYGHLRAEIGAPIALHEADIAAVETGDPDLTCAGWLYNETFHAFPIDQRLQGGERFQIGDFEMEVLHLPGHSPGCIGLNARYARTGQMILIPGDSVLGGYSKRIRSNLTAWRRSLRRLMAAPPDLMLPNHLPPGSQTSLLADVPNRLARVYSLLETDFYSFMAHQRSATSGQF